MSHCVTSWSGPQLLRDMLISQSSNQLFFHMVILLISYPVTGPTVLKKKEIPCGVDSYSRIW